jgi:drug/metabolite transporter (DMT)-like permease
MAFLVSIAYASYQLAASRARQQVDNITFMWVFSLTGAIGLGGAALLLGSSFGGLTTGNILALLALGLLTHTGGWLLINSAYSVLPASAVTIVLLGQPIVATLFAAPILGEVPSWLHVLGGLITLTGIYVVLRSRQPG